MFTFVVLPFAFDFEAQAAGQGDYVKVGLKYGSGSVASCTIESKCGFILGTALDRAFQEGMPLPAYTKITASNESGNIVIRDENGVLLSSDLGSSGCIMPADYGDEGMLSLDGAKYRDGVTFIAKTNGTMTVINYLTLEHYVYGVLNSELGYTNPIEALKAQAVAARSFGELNIGKHAADGFDLCTTTNCQVYKGVAGEYPSIIEAVDGTRGEMIRYNGEPVTAFYFKNGGGYTQNSEDVWSGTQPYLRSVKDEYCPSYPWSTSLSFDAIRTKLEAAGFQPGNVESVSITGRNDTGAVAELKIQGSGATVYLRKDNIRAVLGATLVKSTVFELADCTTAGSSGWKISSGISVATPDKDVYVINGSETVKKLDDENVYGYNGSATVKLGAGSGSAVQTVTGGTAVFNGFGYGHGVGMPQDSAVEMAKQGFTYEEILKYYYTDIEID
jgi:stage II sporulation protein D